MLFFGYSNIRLENYVYTVEVMIEVRRILVDGGMVGVYYSVFKSWLYLCIFKMVVDLFDGYCVLKYYDNMFLFNIVIVCVSNSDLLKSSPVLAEVFERELFSIDDWLFLYLV